MPSRGPRVCGCGKLVEAGQRCTCEVRRRAESDKRRPNSSARGYDGQWEGLAKAFLAEPGNERCQCGRPAILVAHRQSIRRRPDLRLDRRNWRPSCRPCNSRDAETERRNMKGN